MCVYMVQGDRCPHDKSRSTKRNGRGVNGIKGINSERFLSVAASLFVLLLKPRSVCFHDESRQLTQELRGSHRS